MSRILDAGCLVCTPIGDWPALRGLAEDRYQRVWRTLESLLQGEIGHLQNYSMSTVDTRSSPTEIRR